MMTTLHRYRFLLLAVTGVILVAATVYTLNDSPASDEPVGHIGPTPGVSSDGHVRAQRAYLDRLASERPTQKAAALVSLEDYVPASKAQAIARSLDATWVFARFPAAEQEPPQLVRSSITDALQRRAGDLRKELASEITALKAEAAGASGARRTDLEELIAQRESELAKIAPDCACVFAFAIEDASLEALRELARRPEVKLVDVPEPVTSDLGGWELQPIVPRTDTDDADA